MAGFKVLWASEFQDKARETYAANFPDTILDGRDIREVRGEHILDAIGMKPGELDVFEGSPPCDSFSLAGQREKHWGKIKNYANRKQRSDDLFFEYARLVEKIQPRAFVAENVRGLVIGKARGYFLEIMNRLESAGYRVACRVLDAQWLGVPQTRQRTIFVGFRNDLGIDPAEVYPEPLPYRYSIIDAIADLNPEQPVVGCGRRAGEHWADAPAPTVLTHGREHTRSELTAIVGEKKGNRPFVVRNGDEPAYAVVKSPEVMEAIVGQAPAVGFEGVRVRGVDEPSHSILVTPHDAGKCLIVAQAPMVGYDYGTRERTPEEPANTIMQSNRHPNLVLGDGEGTRYRKRKFTIAELKRICSFPDDFELKGSFAEQWARCGYAVPPLMMRAVAEKVRDKLLGLRTG